MYEKIFIIYRKHLVLTFYDNQSVVDYTAGIVKEKLPQCFSLQKHAVNIVPYFKYCLRKYKKIVVIDYHGLSEEMYQYIQYHNHTTIERLTLWRKLDGYF
ncbi:hypothetical protein KG091_01050 [Carnobacteriaceae bacterium zg-ZUI78]|nr:hypothetical protein [Carnobacteriaceae bacterium zg-ZUI78]